MLPFQVSPWTNFCTPLFPTPHYWYAVDMRDAAFIVIGGPNTVLFITAFDIQLPSTESGPTKCFEEPESTNSRLNLAIGEDHLVDETEADA